MQMGGMSVVKAHDSGELDLQVQALELFPRGGGKILRSVAWSIWGDLSNVGLSSSIGSLPVPYSCTRRPLSRAGSIFEGVKAAFECLMWALGFSLSDGGA